MKKIFNIVLIAILLIATRFFSNISPKNHFFSFINGIVICAPIFIFLFHILKKDNLKIKSEN